MSQEQWIEVSGSDIEEAIEAGLRQLGLARKDVIIEVVDEGRRGILGLGSREATVRIRPLPRPVAQPRARISPETSVVEEEVIEETAAPEPKVTETEPATPEPEEEQEQPVAVAVEEEVEPVVEEAAPEESVGAREESAPEPAPEPTEEEPVVAETVAGETEEVGAEPEDVEGAQVALGIVQTLLDKMGFGDAEASIIYSEPDDKTGRVMPVIQVEGDDLGSLIGPHGTGLADFQYLARLMAGHALRARANFLIDINHYREKRQEALAKLARRMADKAVDRGKAVTLEPMSAYDRRLIHMALRDDDRVYTNSVGEGPNRRVRVFVNKE